MEKFKMKLDIHSAKRLLSLSASGLRSTPLPCRISYVLLLLGFLVAIVAESSIVEALTVTPFRLLPPNFWIWTLSTFWFVETNVVLLLCHLICVHISGAVLFPLWGWRQWLYYFALTNVVAALCSVLLSSAIYSASNLEEWYFYNARFPNNIRGLAAFDGAVFIAVKQALPETTIFNTPWFGRYKNSHIPFTAVVVGIFIAIFRLLSPVYLMQYVFGSYVGWVYLRFYQRHSNVGSPPGDPSDNFTFASFFPSILQGPVSTVSDFCYRTAVRFKLCKPVVRRFVDMGGLGGSLQSVVTPTAISASQADAERRRQKALKDLNERLAKAKEQSSQGTLAWPSLVDDEEEKVERGRELQPSTHGVSISQKDSSGASPSEAQSPSSVTVREQDGSDDI